MNKNLFTSNFKCELMKKFLIEVTLAVVLVLLTGYFFLRIDTPSAITKRIQNIDKKLEIVNLGTSHGNDFDYSICSLNGQRINREGNTLYYDLQNYIYLNNSGYLEDKAFVIIPVSYFVFGLDENRSDRLPDNSFVNEFYYYLPKEQIFLYSEEKVASLTILSIQKNFENIFRANRNKNRSNIVTTEAKLKQHALSRVKHHKRLSEFSSKEKNYNYLESLVETILENKHIPILVSTPYFNSYNENFGKEWLDENYFKIMHNMSNKYNVTYLDYSHDNRLSNNAKYFINSDHLNSSGQKVFSEFLFEDLGI